MNRTAGWRRSVPRFSYANFPQHPRQASGERTKSMNNGRIQLRLEMNGFDERRENTSKAGLIMDKSRYICTDCHIQHA